MVAPQKKGNRHMEIAGGPDYLLRAELRECEEHIWEALVSGDQRADDEALAESFLGVYSDGFSGKSDHVRQLTDGPTIKSYKLSDLRVRKLGNDHAVLSYRAAFCRRTRTDPEEMYVSSIWQRAGEGWINIFSQDTPHIPHQNP